MPFIPFVEADSNSCSTSTAPQNALPNSNPDYEYESDIVDQCGSMMDGLEHQDIPQRPSSRLGFHSPPSNHHIADLEDPNEDTPETVNWTHMASDAVTMHSRIDLASTSYDFDEDITTVASADALQTHEPPLSTSINITDTSYLNPTNPFSLSDDDESDGSDSDCSSCENEDEDFEFSLTSVLLPSKPSSSTPTFTAPVAHFSTSSTLAPRPPSPTEPKPITPVRLLPLKPSYSNHGYSRHALLHLKYFWAVREGKWAEGDDRMCDSKAYSGPSQSSQSGGLSPLRSSTHRNLAQRLKLKGPLRSSILPPMSVHPRRGDIAALRDPYSMHMDRCFVNIPSWTLAKTMYMFDVHVGYEWHSRVTAMSKRKRCDDNVGVSQGVDTKAGTEARWNNEISTDTVDDVDPDSESESLGTSASIASSDDSDATLVENENDGNLEREDYSTFEALMSGAGPSSPSSLSEHSFTTPRFKCVSPTMCPAEELSSKSPLSLSLYAQMPSRSMELLSCLNDSKSTKPWVTNWYRRWEILLDLMRSNWDQHQFFAALSINEYPYCAEQSSCSSNSNAEVAGRKGKRQLRRQPWLYFEDKNSSEDSDCWEWDPSFDWKNMGQISGGFGLGIQSLDGSVLL